MFKASDQTPNFSSTNQEGNKKSSLDYKLTELLLHLKVLHISTILVIFIAQIYTFLSKIIYSLTKEPKEKK